VISNARYHRPPGDHLSTFNNYWDASDEGNDCLTDLYQLGILRASNIAFTRTKEDINSVYEYLSLDSLEGYDSFKWSPLENRPVLIERLRKRFLQLLERGADESVLGLREGSKTSTPSKHIFSLIHDRNLLVRLGVSSFVKRAAA
jgi:hypothetical protein